LDDTRGPLVTVLVLNYSRRADTLICLESVKRQTYKPIEILVVDNASADDSVEAIARAFPDVRQVVLDRNYGCPGGRNRGIDLADSEYVFCADNDGILHERAVERAYAAIRRDERIGVVGGRVMPFDTLDEVDAAFPLADGDESRYRATFLGTVTLHRRSLHRRVGGYPEHYMYAGEEDYLSIKLLERGYLIVEDPGVVIWHKKSEVARDWTDELIYRQANALANRLTFWPWELVVPWVLRQVLRDPVRALRRRVFATWLAKWPTAMLAAARTAMRSRRPVSRRSMKILHKLFWRHVTSAQAALRPDVPYWRCLLTAILRGR